MASFKDDTNTGPEQIDVDARQTELSKTDSQLTSLTTSIRTGCVAERILQLQAKLTPKKDDLHTSPAFHKSPCSPLASALAKYSVSKHLLTPRSIPLPETPSKSIANHNPSSRLLGVAQKWTSTIASPSKSGDLEVNTSATIGADESQGIERFECETERDQSNGSRLYHKGSKSLQGQLINQGIHGDPQSLPIVMPEEQVISAEYLSSDSPSCNQRFAIAPIMDTCYAKPEDSSQMPRLFKHNAATKSPGIDLNRPSEVKRKSSATSPESAYSKILPFILSPSVNSYVPRRQGPNYDLDQEVSPARLRKMDSIEIIGPITPGSPRLSPSPRQRDQRSLRRRTFNSISEDTLRKGTDEIDSAGQGLCLVSSTMTLEDVFTTPACTAELYHPEHPQIAGNNTLASPKSLHDIHNPSYVPSVMPRRVGSRQVLQSRHQRSISALNVQKQRPTILAANSGTDGLAKSPLINDTAPEPEKSVYMETINNTADTDNYATYDYRPIQRAPSPTTDQRVPIEEPQLSEGEKTVQMQQSRNLAIEISTGDGPSGDYGGHYHGHTRYKSISVTGISSPRTSKSKIPRPSSSDDNGTIRILPARNDNTLPIQYTSKRSERELKVVLTINQGVQDVIKIEVHPYEMSHNSHNKENRME